MNSNDQDYEQIMKKRSDGFLSYVAKSAEDDMLSEFDLWEKENPDLCVPKNIESEILAMAYQFNKIQINKKRKKNLYQFAKVAAVIILVITTAFTALAINVEAVKTRVFEFLFQENKEYINVTPVETNGNEAEIKGSLPIGWEGFYYLNYLPKDYEFVKSEEVGNAKIIYFQDDTQNLIVFSQEDWESTQLLVNNEVSERAEITVNGDTAFWFSKNNETTLIWNQNNYGLVVYGPIDIEELIKIAENLIFIK